MLETTAITKDFRSGARIALRINDSRHHCNLSLDDKGRYCIKFRARGYHGIKDFKLIMTEEPDLTYLNLSDLYSLYFFFERCIQDKKMILNNRNPEPLYRIDISHIRRIQENIQLFIGDMISIRPESSFADHAAQWLEKHPGYQTQQQMEDAVDIRPAEQDSPQFLSGISLATSISNCQVYSGFELDEKARFCIKIFLPDGGYNGIKRFKLIMTEEPDFGYLDSFRLFSLLQFYQHCIDTRSLLSETQLNNAQLQNIQKLIVKTENFVYTYFNLDPKKDQKRFNMWFDFWTAWYNDLQEGDYEQVVSCDNYRDVEHLLPKGDWKTENHQTLLHA